MAPEFYPPERLQSQFLPGPVPACQPHAPQPAKGAHLAQFVVAKGGLKIRRELLPEFLQAFLRALQRPGVAHTHKCRVARVITIRDHIIGRAGASNERIEQVVLVKRTAQPDKITVSPHEQADQRALHMAGFVVITARPLHRARVMNITHNRNLITAGHTALFINTPANKNRTLLQCSYPNLSTVANHRCSVGPLERTKTGTAIASIEPLRRLLKLAKIG